jgi:uncharacterized protein
MKILIALNHPAHFHLFKNSAKELQQTGHKILFVYKHKDILEKLLENFEFDSIKLSDKRYTGDSKLDIIKDRLYELAVQDKNLYKSVRKFCPDLMAGTDISIAHVGWIARIPTLIFNEDDIEINRFFCYSTYPFANHIISPFVCNVGNFQNKKISYNGYQKLAYLHPKRFSPDKYKVQESISLDKPYFLVRLVSFTAGHDVEQKHSGITDSLLQQIIDRLSDYGNVYLSSEMPVKKEFSKYVLEINPLEIHHFLYFADLLVADSQSMIVESAVIGTPSIRFNSFVGRISVLNELEKYYQLTTGIQTNHPELLLDKIIELSSKEDLKSIYLKRKKIMLQDKIDLTAFMVWFIENYPDSVKLIKENPEYQMEFK